MILVLESLEIVMVLQNYRELYLMGKFSHYKIRIQSNLNKSMFIDNNKGSVNNILNTLGLEGGTATK